MTGRPVDYATVPAPGSWAERGLCHGEPTAEFFSHKVTRRARQLCDDCPVNSDCLRYALDHDVRGTWAGTTWEQRERMRRR